MASVAARGFQGVARTGLFSDPPLASKNSPWGQGRAPPPAPARSTRAPPWPRPRGGSASVRHRILSTGVSRVSSGHRTYLDSARYLGGQSECRFTHWPSRWHFFGSTSLELPGGLAPAALRAGPLNHWPSGSDVCPRRYSGDLPALPRGCQRTATPLASGLSVHVTPLRRTARAGGGARSLGAMRGSHLCATARSQPEAATPHPCRKSPRGIRVQVHSQIEGRGRNRYSVGWLRLKGGHLGPRWLGRPREGSRLAGRSSSLQLKSDPGTHAGDPLPGILSTLIPPALSKSAFCLPPQPTVLG